MRSWLEPSIARERLLMGLGSLAVGVILTQAAIIGPASDCGRRALHEGGDMVPGFCVDYGAAWSGWPLLLAGTGALALGTFLLDRAAQATRSPTTLRAALLLAVLGAIIMYAGWTHGTQGICSASESGPGTCWRETAAWQPWAYAGGGALAGAAAALALVVGIRAWPALRSD